MREYLPLLIVGGIIGAFTGIFIIAYAMVRNKKEAMGFERNMDDSEIIRRLLSYARPYWKQFALTLAVMMFSVVYDVLSPLLVGRIVGMVQEDFVLSELYGMVAVYASILLVSLLCTYAQAMLLQKTGQKILSQIRLDVFTHIEQLSHEQLNNIPVGTLVTRVSNDPNAISFMFTNILVTLVKNIMVVFGVLAAMLMLNYALTLMVLCFVPFVAMFTLFFRRFSRKAHRAVTNATTDLNTFLSENLSGMKIIQIFNREDRKMDDFMVRTRALRKAKLGRMVVFGIFRPMVYMLNISATLCLLYLGSRAHILGKEWFGQVIDSAVVVSFYMYIGKFFNPIQALAEQFDMLQRSFAAAEKIFSIIDLQPQVVDDPDAMELEEIRGEIEFKDVWFSYKPDEWVLKGVSFKVEAGQAVAFVGSTGSGKTTILSLICRNYDIQKGQILIDGIDIRKIGRASCRERV